MTIWLLAILLLAALAALGFRQGAIRVAFSFFGIVIGALLAAPLGHLLRPLVSMAGIKHPLWLALLPPCVGFLLVMTIFKIGGYVVHRKAENHYRYKASELQLALWERMHHGLGLCLGLLNGAAYLVLICLPIYMLSYWTYQMATPESDPKSVQVLNRLGKDLETTGMNKVAAANDRMPAAYYQAADIVGMIYHQPLLQARLARYPAFLALAERPEFQAIASDTDFANLTLTQKPILEVINYPKVQDIIKNPETVQTITNALFPNLVDLSNYLATGASPIFDSELILGRWDFDVNGALALLRRARPNLTPTEAQRLKIFFSANYAKTSFMAAPDLGGSGSLAVLKDFPHVRPGPPASVELQKSEGHWSNSAGRYEVTLSLEGKEQRLVADIHGDRLTLTNPELNLAFIRED
jgi:hypothetical protein